MQYGSVPPAGGAEGAGAVGNTAMQPTKATIKAQGRVKVPPPIDAQGRVKVPPPIDAQGRVKTETPGPTLSICEAAGKAKARNSPAAVGLIAQCLAAGGKPIAP
jgi:hypothetical protein